MTRSDRKSQLLRSPLAKALSASAALHLAACCLFAAWSVAEPTMQPRFQGDAATAQIVLQLEMQPPRPPIVELPFAGQRVLIMPGWAQLAEQTFLDTRAADVPLEDLIAEDLLEVVPAEDLLEQLNSASPPAQEPPASLAPPRAPQEAQSAPRQPPQRQLQDFSTAQATPPDFSGNRPPRYPARDIQLGREGLVVLRLHVDQTGRVTEVGLVRSSGYATLDAAAASAVRTWRGSPAQRDGKPVATTWDLPVRFRLNR